MGPRGRGAPWGVGRALHPRGQVLAPPAVFSVPEILKYSRKNHISISGHLENFYCRGIFLLHGELRKLTENTNFTLFQLNNKK